MAAWDTSRLRGKVSPLALAHAIKEKEDAVARDADLALLAKYGAPIDIDPGVALMQELQRTAGHVAWLEKKVREVDESFMFWSQAQEQVEIGLVLGKVVDVTRRLYTNEQNKWWQMYERERDRMARLSALAIKAGLEERRVRLAEQSVDRLEGAVLNALSDLGLDPSDASVRRVVAARLAEALGGDTGVLVPGGAVADGTPAVAALDRSDRGSFTVDGTVLEHGESWADRGDTDGSTAHSAGNGRANRAKSASNSTLPEPLDF